MQLQCTDTLDLLLCYPLMWNITLEYTATHFNVLGQTRPENPSPTFHTHQRKLKLYNAVMLVVSQKLCRKCTVPTESWTRDLWFVNPLRYRLAHSSFFKYLFTITKIRIWILNLTRFLWCNLCLICEKWPSCEAALCLGPQLQACLIVKWPQKLHVLKIPKTENNFFLESVTRLFQWIAIKGEVPSIWSHSKNEGLNNMNMHG